MDTTMPDAGRAVNPSGPTADPGELFRYAPARPVIEIMVLTWLAGLLGVAGMLAVSGARLSLATLAIVGFQVNAGGLLHWLTLRRCGVRVGPAGLAAVAPLQPDRRVRWADVHTARPWHLFLTPRLTLHGPGVRLVLPLVFVDPEGFAEAVARHAGDDHPLTLALRERPSDD